MSFWEIVGISLTSGGMVATLFVFLAKAFLEHQLGKALEKFKVDLEAEHHRASLKFGVLHEERKRHVLALYDATVEARSALNKMLHRSQSPDRSLSNQLKAAANGFEKLHNANVAARIVLSDEEHAVISKMVDGYWGAYVHAETIVQMSRGEEGELWRSHAPGWQECRTKMKAVEEGEEKTVRDQLRRILGVA